MTKPVAILQHETNQGPGVLLEHLQQHDIPYEIIRPTEDGRAPRTPATGAASSSSAATME